MNNIKDDLESYLNDFVSKENEKLDQEQEKKAGTEKEKEILERVGEAILDPDVENLEQFSLIKDYLSKNFESNEVNKYIRIIMASSKLKAIANSDKQPQSKTIHDMIEKIIVKLDSDKSIVENKLGINKNEIDRYLNEIEQSKDFANTFIDEDGNIKRYSSDNLVDLVSFLKTIITDEEEINQVYQIMVSVISSGIELSKNDVLDASTEEQQVVNDDIIIDNEENATDDEVIDAFEEPGANEIIDIDEKSESDTVPVREIQEVNETIVTPVENVATPDNSFESDLIDNTDEETETIDIKEDKLNTQAMTEIIDDIYLEKQSLLDFSKIPNVTIASLYNSTSPEVRKLIYSSTEEDLKWDVILYDWINNLKPNIENEDITLVVEDIINTYENDYLYLPQDILNSYIENKKEFDEETENLSEQEHTYLQQVNIYLEQDNYEFANKLIQNLPEDGIIRSFLAIPKKYNEYTDAKENYQKAKDLYLGNGDNGIYKTAKKELSECRNNLIEMMNEFSSTKSNTYQNLVLGKVA